MKSLARIIVTIAAAACLACSGSTFSVADAGADAQGDDAQGDAGAELEGAAGDARADVDGVHDADAGDELDAGDGAPFDPRGWCCGASSDECGEGGLQWVCLSDGGTGVTYCLSLTMPCAGSCAFFDPMKDADVNGQPHPCS
jgi:hypothetical protein